MAVWDGATELAARGGECVVEPTMAVWDGATERCRPCGWPPLEPTMAMWEWATELGMAQADAETAEYRYRRRTNASLADTFG